MRFSACGFCRTLFFIFASIRLICSLRVGGDTRLSVVPKMHRSQLLFEKLTDLYVLLLITVFFLYTGSGGYESILNSKAWAFYLLSGGYIILTLIFLGEGILVGVLPRPSFKAIWLGASAFQKFIVLYLLFTWISCLISPYMPLCILGASRYEGALAITVYGICSIFVSNWGKVKASWVWATGISMTIFSVLCLIQIHGQNPLTLYPEGYTYLDAYSAYSGAYLGTVGNVDLVAAVFSLTIPLLTGICLKCTGRLRFLLLFPLVLSICILIQMGVLAGFVGVLGGIVILLTVWVPRSVKSRNLTWLLLFVLAFVLLTVVFLCDIGDGIFHEAHNLLHGNFNPKFGSGRIYIWKEVLERVPSHLWFGTGPDTMLLTGIEGFSRFDPSLSIQIISEIDVAHNEYLNVLSQQGMLALVAYLSALGCLALKWIKQGLRCTKIAILGGAILGYSIQAFFGFSSCITAPIFWLCLGLLDGSDPSANSEKNGRSKQS